MFKGDFGRDYIGYPIGLIRIGQSFITSISFSIFGVSERSTLVFPMIFSVMNMILNYKLAKALVKSEIVSVMVLLFTAFYPTEVLFASLAFTDIYSTFFINLGILFLLLADGNKKALYAVLGGLSLALSMMFKENAFYTAVLLTGLLFFILVWKKTFNKYIFISLAVLGLGMCIEGLIYYFLNGNFFYRMEVMESNFQFCEHDFTSEKSIFKLIFLNNPTAIFLRRSMVFLPLLAVLQLIVNRKNRINRLVVYWFSGLLIMYMFFSISFSTYQPIDIRFTWYLFPIFLPSMILVSKLLSELKKWWMFVSLASCISFSILMTAQFQQYFGTDKIVQFKKYLRSDTETLIYTDHFTKYSIDLIDDYKEPSRVIRLNYAEENIIPAGALVVYHTGHISETAKQGFYYPDDSYYTAEGFEELQRFGQFVIYEKK